MKLCPQVDLDKAHTQCTRTVTPVRRGVGSFESSQSWTRFSTTLWIIACLFQAIQVLVGQIGEARCPGTRAALSVARRQPPGPCFRQHEWPLEAQELRMEEKSCGHLAVDWVPIRCKDLVGRAKTVPIPKMMFLTSSSGPRVLCKHSVQRKRSGRCDKLNTFPSPCACLYPWILGRRFKYSIPELQG